MKIHRDLQQKTWPWFLARAGKVTGSELGNLITDKGKLRGWNTGMPNSYLHRKLAEKWRGAPLETFMGSRQTDQGNIWEPQARPYFAALLETDIEQVGGMESDDGRLWCSPDGIVAGACPDCNGNGFWNHQLPSGEPEPVQCERCLGTGKAGEGVGVEIKCPNADTHIGWLLDGPRVPEEHILQCQFALFVTGWPMWKFLSYVKDVPHLAVDVAPDGEVAETIAEAVHEFQARFEAAWSQLCDLNGGPPPPRPEFTTSPGPIKFSWERDSQDTNDVPIP